MILLYYFRLPKWHADRTRVVPSFWIDFSSLKRKKSCSRNSCPVCNEISSRKVQKLKIYQSASQGRRQSLRPFPNSCVSLKPFFVKDSNMNCRGLRRTTNSVSKRFELSSSPESPKWNLTTLAETLRLTRWKRICRWSLPTLKKWRKRHCPRSFASRSPWQPRKRQPCLSSAPDTKPGPKR